MTRIQVLIVAAGRGERLGGTVPKQYLPLAGVPLVRHAADGFTGHPGVTRVLVAIRAEDRALAEACLPGLELVEGGAERQETVLRGLEAMEGDPPDLVLIHDAARPLVDGACVDRVIAALSDHDGAIPALPVIDTIKRAGTDERIAGTIDRTTLRRAQTPQGFRYAALLAAHRAAAPGATDDAAIAENAGLDVVLVRGSERMMKVTVMEDLMLAERWLPVLEPRVGSGFDVHGFCPGDHVILGGVRIPHDQGLEGHSDADAGLHALTDAILGALAEGDIGALFPPGEMKWRGADSAIFLAEACRRVAARGGRIAHLDLTLICERPKIGPHREAMRARIAGIAGIEPGRVGVKATTTEGLGFTGRREGIAAQATATLLLPALAS